MSRYEKPVWKVFNVVVVCAILAVLVWASWHTPAKLGLLLCIPAVGWFASRALVHGGFNFFEWISRLPYAGWNGRYYEFNNEQIRVYEHHDRLLFVADDVLRATRVATSPGSYVAVHSDELTDIPRSRHRGYGIKQIERLANEHPGTEAGRFLLWAQREVVGPWEKKRGS